MSLTKNSAIVVTGIIISNLLAYVFHIYVGRVLGPAEYGVFGALMGILLILVLPGQAIGFSTTRYVAKYNSKGQKGQIGLLRRHLTKKVVTYAIIILFGLVILSKPIASYLNIDSSFSIILVGFSTVFALILPINRGILQGMKKFKGYSINTISEAIIRLVLVVLFVFIGLRADGAILAYGLAYLFAFLLVFPLIRDTGNKISEDGLKSPGFLKFAILVLIISLLVQGIINLPTVFIKHYFSAEFTGLWTAALTLARTSLFVTTGITLVMFSEVSSEKNKKNKRDLFRRAFLLTLISSIFIALIFFIIPEMFIDILYGQEFFGAVSILKWMGFAMIFVGLFQLGLNYRLAERN